MGLYDIDLIFDHLDRLECLFCVSDAEIERKFDNRISSHFIALFQT